MGQVIQIVLSPLLDDNPCFFQAVEDLGVHQLIAWFSIEVFAVPQGLLRDVKRFGSELG
jgi:hypothetical protein